MKGHTEGKCEEKRGRGREVGSDSEGVDRKKERESERED